MAVQLVGVAPGVIPTIGVGNVTSAPILIGEVDSTSTPSGVLVPVPGRPADMNLSIALAVAL
jgi:hypothetical protein